MNEQEQLSHAYSDLKDKHILLRRKYSAQQKEIKSLQNTLLLLRDKLHNTNQQVDRLLWEKWLFKPKNNDDLSF